MSLLSHRQDKQEEGAAGVGGFIATTITVTVTSPIEVGSFLLLANSAERYLSDFTVN